MRPLRFILAAFLLLLSLPGSFAQSTKVRGRVIDESTGEGIPYAGVFFKGSTVGATTDTDGWFALETREDSLSVITVSRMGYLPSETVIAPKRFNTVYFRLKPFEDVLDPAYVKADDRYVKSLNSFPGVSISSTNTWTRL